MGSWARSRPSSARDARVGGERIVGGRARPALEDRLAANQRTGRLRFPTASCVCRRSKVGGGTGR